MVTPAGILDKSIKNLLMRNLGELSGVQGNLLSAAEKKDVKSIFVTSCRPHEGKSVSAVGMAYALATEANAKVLLIDGNFNFPKIHEFFNLEVRPGFSDLLAADATYNQIIRKTEYDNLKIIPHGSKIPSLFDVYRSKTFMEKLSPLRDSIDYLIFDGHSIFGSSDASVIGKYFDGIVLVVECERTRWEVVQMAKEKLHKAGGNILGVVLNKRKYYIPQALYGGG